MVNELNAGPEMDREVARTVFGWTCIHEPRVLTKEEAMESARAYYLEAGEDPPTSWESDVLWELDSDYPPKKCAKCGIPDTDGGLYIRLPQYSTNIADAWFVFEWLSRQYDYVAIEHDTTASELWTVQGADVVENPNMKFCIIRTANTAELAICRAAVDFANRVTP